MRYQSTLFLLGASSAQAFSVSPTKYLLVTSYDGHLRTLAHTNFANGRFGKSAGLEQLKTVQSSTGCGSSPSWGTLDGHTLYCVDEGLSTVNGTLTTYNVKADGSVKPLHQATTPGGPVHAVRYGEGGLAMPHYSTSTFSTWDVTDPTAFTALTAETFKLSQPGADPSRQDAPHPHETVLDPTGKFILVPDLGADLVHVYGVQHGSLALKELSPLTVTAGDGPRHLAFAVHGDKTFMYLVTELSNSLLGYEVTYSGGDIKFKQFWSSGTWGKGKTVPSGTASAEVIVSPDAKFLILSTRYDQSFNIPAFSANSTTDTIKSDSLVNFSINEKTGDLTFIETVAAGGNTPRQFSINKAGTEVACGLQDSGRVTIRARDPKSGKFGDFLSYAEFGATGVTSVIYADCS